MTSTNSVASHWFLLFGQGAKLEFGFPKWSYYSKGVFIRNKNAFVGLTDINQFGDKDGGQNVHTDRHIFSLAGSNLQDCVGDKAQRNPVGD